MCIYIYRYTYISPVAGTKHDRTSPFRLGAHEDPRI